MANTIMSYNSSLENYRRAGIVSEFEAAEAITAGDMVYLDGAGQIRQASHPMILFGQGGISGVAETTAAVGEDVIVWQTGVFEFATSEPQRIVPGNYLYVASVITVDLNADGGAQEISMGVAETGTAGAAAGELVEVFITPTRKRSPYVYSHTPAYL